MAKIVGIHGIAQQYKGGYELGRAWRDSMRDGLVTAGHRKVAEGLEASDVRVAFFGDLFRPPGAMPGGEPPYTADDVESGPEQQLLHAWYDAAVKQDPALGPPPGALGPGTLAVEAMLSRLLRSRTFARIAERGFIGGLKQVTAFLKQPEVKKLVFERIEEAIAPDTRVVVGHSLGSIVIYEYLARFSPPGVQLLITLGSPLGIPNLIFEKLTPSPVAGVGGWPGTTASWVNVADPEDIVALIKRLQPLFQDRVATNRISDHVVENGDEPHSVSRYLNAKPTGSALATAL